jgi:peroxiredoxin
MHTIVPTQNDRARPGSVLMKNCLTLMVVAAMLFAGCKSKTAPTPREIKLPAFTNKDSDGNTINSEQLRNTPLIVVFFDADSVLSWRIMADIKKAALGKSEKLTVLGVAASNAEPFALEASGINETRHEYDITFPVIIDNSKQLFRFFQASSCCDAVQAYDSEGVLRTSDNLSDPRLNLEAMIASVLKDSASASTTATAPAKIDLSSIMVREPSGAMKPVPLADRGLTIINIFSDFCVECDTGRRLQTLRRITPRLSADSKILVIFSQAEFSTQDVDNFKTLLATPFEMYEGDVSALKNYLDSGRLLLIVDSNKNIIWQTSSDMSEDEVASRLFQLIEEHTQ